MVRVDNNGKIGKYEIEWEDKDAIFAALEHYIARIRDENHIAEITTVGKHKKSNISEVTDIIVRKLYI